MRIVTIKFRDAGKRYDFNALQFELDFGSQVVVETDRGRALGTVVVPPREAAEGDPPKELKSVLRPANEEDLRLSAMNQQRERDAFKFCQKRIAERQMEMKLVRAEYLFDGSKIIFYFTADGRVDFRELVKDLAHHFHTRIEMRQIGVRDEAKLCGGLGVCGRELCCCTFLTEFNPVSVKMAKEQGLALNPNKISGQCGRLLCCLGYEHETYCSLRRGLPKAGKKIEFDSRQAEVLEVNVLRQTVTLQFEEGSRVDLSAEQFASGRLAEPLEGKSPPAEKSSGAQPGGSKTGGPGGRGSRPSQKAKPAKSGPKSPAPAPQPGASPDAAPADGENKPKRRRRRSKRRPKSN